MTDDDFNTVIADVLADFAERRAKRKARPLNAQLADAIRKVDGIPAAYMRGLDALDDTDHDPLIRSSTAGGIRSAGKPTSHPPSGADRTLRALLITAVQHVVEAIRHLAPVWDWNGADFLPPWEPAEVAYTTLRQGRALYIRNGDGSVCWREADDPTTTLVAYSAVVHGATQLRGLLLWLERFNWDDLDDDSPSVVMVHDSLEQIAKAGGVLSRAGVWAVPKGDPQCGHCGAYVRKLQTVVPPRCAACYEYQRRTGRDRPRHLWEAA